ncbi:MAG: sulfite exporter TauE/SafE family protein [Gemmatimonas sp.]|nr:sulfite exporter TauE/SafE family protein [Gemmatimonadaceae bacterium]
MQLPTDPGSLTARNALFIALGIVTAGYFVVLAQSFKALAISIISFIANFFDTLGIGSFATTTAMVRQFKLIPDEHIPGSLNVGYVIPTVVQAYIYTQLVPVDITTLISLIAAAVFGAWLGAGVVASWPRRKVQVGMGAALLVAAVIMVAKQPQIGLMPAGGDALALTGTKLIVGIVGNFILGAFMTIGIGLYAPCMILIYLLGMRPTAAFPIMMGSCAFLMPLASVQFIRAGSYSRSAVIGMLIAGIPAVFIAALLVKSMPLSTVQWLVVVVVTYTAVSLLRAARRERDLASTATAAEAQPAAS